MKNVNQALSSVEKRLLRSEKLINKASTATQRQARVAVQSEKKAQAQIAREQQKTEAKRVRDAAAAQKKIERERIASAKKLAQAEIRAQKAAQRARVQLERATARKVKAVRSVGAKGLGTASRFVGGTAALVGGFSAAQGIGERIALNTRASGLANRTLAAGSNGGKSHRELTTDIMDRSQASQKKFGLSSAESAFAVEDQFNALTGAFQEGKGLANDIITMGMALGVAEDELGSLGTAAGTLFNSFKEGGKTAKEAADATKKVMLAGLGGSAQGAITLDELSKIAPKLLSVSGAIGGDKEINAGRTMALAQNLRGTSVATSEETATVLQTMSADFRNKSDQFKKLGVKTNDSTGSMRDLQDLIVETAMKSGGDSSKLKGLFSSNSDAALQQKFATVRNMRADGKSDADIEKALRAPFEVLNQAALTEAKARELAANQIETDSAKSNRLMGEFKNALGKQLTPALMDLLPHLKDLIPIVKDGLIYLSKFLNWFSDNPIQGIESLILASIAKDMAGSQISKLLTSLLTKQLGGASAGAPGVGGAQTVKGAGFLGTAAAVLFSAEVGRLIGKAAADMLGDAWDNASRDASKTNIELINAMSAKTLKEKQAKLKEVDKSIAADFAERESFTGSLGVGLNSVINTFMPEDSQVEDGTFNQIKENMKLRTELEKQIAALKKEELEQQLEDVKTITAEKKALVEQTIKELQGAKKGVHMNSGAPPTSGR